MGGGQLGRMFTIAARRMGYRVHSFSPEVNGPAAQFSDCATAASYDDEAAVTQFAREIDVLTFEFENIPAATIEWATRDRIVRPRGEILLIAQNRLREKEFLSSAGFPVAPFRRVANNADLTSALEAIGRPSILKGAAFGYDGIGQQRIDPGTGRRGSVGGAEGRRVRARKRDRFREGDFGHRRARHRWRNGGLSQFAKMFIEITSSISPWRRREWTIVLPDAARELACAVARKLDLVGLLAVEMFLKGDDELIINELAPRPHNSGHWTIEGCVTSQFEQHVRAVCGLPLGATELVAPLGDGESARQTFGAGASRTGPPRSRSPMCICISTASTSRVRAARWVT